MLNKVLGVNKIGPLLGLLGPPKLWDLDLALRWPAHLEGKVGSKVLACLVRAAVAEARPGLEAWK